MARNKVTSLRRFRAQRIYENFMSLPVSQRTNARAALLLEAIFDYAYEHVPQVRRFSTRRARITEEESARITERIEEFLPPGNSREPIMRWLHDNMVSEAWSYPEDRRHFIRDCLRR